MGHGHTHGHDADSGHGQAPGPTDTGAGQILNAEVPDRELSVEDLSRRRFLRNAGLIGAAASAGVGGLGVAGATPAAAAYPRPAAGGGDAYRWSAGDHHIHTQYSGGSDAPYRIDQQVEHGARFGLGWVVITDHGGPLHQKFGVEETYDDIKLARERNKDVLVFQGLEWNPPAGDHSTVFVAPGANEAVVLKEFEELYDRAVLGGATSDSTPPNEAKAVEAVRWLEGQVSSGRVDGALQILHHASRSGLYSPSEMRNLRDGAPTVAIGMEGAPGHQAASIPTSAGGAGAGRGFYDNGPGARSYAGYPLESYRTYGGFDWLTAKLGGVWDSLLAEGRPYWITATSDSHQVYQDSWVYGGAPTADGIYRDPVFTRTPVNGRGDFWPGQYSRTHLGLRDFSYASVVTAMRSGRIWVDHGQLIESLSLSVSGGGRQSPGTLGDVVTAERGDHVDVTVTIGLPSVPNFNGDRPRLRRVDLIAGPITGPATDRNTQEAPGTSVIRSWEVGGGSDGVVEVSHRFKKVDAPFYLRLRGTDGHFSAPGSIEPRQDPIGAVDPWTDLWFYTNPVFVVT